MNKHVEMFLGNYLYPTLSALTILILAFLWSKASTGDWFKAVFSVPIYVWLAIITVIILWVIFIGINKRMKRIQGEGHVVALVGPPAYGWDELGEYPFKEVLWPVHKPHDKWAFISQEPLKVTDVSVGFTPRCPKCKTELEEQKRFWGGYLWTCPDCGFSKTNKDSFITESERAEKIVHRDGREYLRGLQNR